VDDPRFIFLVIKVSNCVPLGMQKVKQVLQKVTYPTWAIIIFVLFVYFYTKELYSISDFGIFYLAVQDFWQGIDIYTKLYTDCNCWHYFYSPFFALSFSSIMTWLSVESASWVWKFVNLILLYRNWVLFAQYYDLKVLNKKDIRYWSLITFIGGLFLIYLNLHNNQMTIFIVWSIFESIRLINNGDEWLGSLILAVGINFKILPIILIPYLLYRGNFSSTWKTLLWFVVLLFIPALFVGFEYNNLLLDKWWGLINPLNKEHNLDVSEKGLTSITTLIPVLFIENYTWDTAFSWSRHIVDLSEKTVVIMVQLARIVIVLYMFYFLRTKVLVAEKIKIKMMWELSYLLIAGVLIFPHQQQYAFYLVFPAIVYVVYAIILEIKVKPRSKFVWGPVLVVMFLLISSEFYFGNFHAFIRYVKLLTYGTLFLIVVLSYLKPDRVLKNIKFLKGRI
tara:strand:- start:1327 stop:2673 length:1347 start_codon:yes stop_codon:yes gene_type:complete